MVGMLLLIPLLPLAGFLINAVVRTPADEVRLGRRRLRGDDWRPLRVALMSVLAMIAHAGAVQQNVFTWFASGNLQVPFSLRLDHLSSVMILVITGIGSLIHIYSTGYMHDEPDSEFARYFSYLNLFASFMLVLVLGASFPVMFVGWEGVGSARTC